MHVSPFLVYLLFEVVITADNNIALNKPCIQSNTHSGSGNTHSCNWAVDGSKTTIPSSTLRQDEPYWQLDLQGYYVVSNISVTSDSGPWSVSINSAKIAITSYDMVCNRGPVIVCGQWPSTDHRNQTLVFTCTATTAVRYIRIWREENGYLVIKEVEAKGKPIKTFGMNSLMRMRFNRTGSAKVSTPVSTLSVSYKAECATACYDTQPCIVFSYSTSQSPNCILGSELSNTTDASWDTFNVEDCFTMDIC